MNTSTEKNEIWYRDWLCVLGVAFCVCVVSAFAWGAVELGWFGEPTHNILDLAVVGAIDFAFFGALWLWNK